MNKLPKTYLLGFTEVYENGLLSYLEDTNQKEFYEYYVEASQNGLSSGEILCSFYAKLCYKSLVLGKNLNISKIRDIQDNLKGCFDTKHGSIFEHFQLNFVTTNCSRIYTHEQVRHRVGVAYCLSEDTKIKFLLASGKIREISIKDLYYKWTNGRSHQNTIKDNIYSKNRIKRMKLRVLDEHKQEFTLGNIENIVDSGIQDIFKIKLNNGQEIECTENHQIYTINGWKTIKTGLKTTDFVGTNGIKYAGNGKYRDKTYLMECKNNEMSVQDIANECEVSYYTIRTWLRKYNLQFDKNIFLFKKNHIPWNKGKFGYNINLTESGRSALIENGKKNKGSKNGAYRGGITPDRAKIAAWAVEQAPKIHKKYNYICQNCGIVGGKLEVHHVEPVAQNINRAYDIDNLCSVCTSCHDKIHKSINNEKVFADKFFNKEVVFPIKSYKKSSKLKPKFVKIDSIVYIGKKQTYDIETIDPHHNFIANDIVVHNSQTSGRYVSIDTLDLVIDPILNDCLSEIDELRLVTETYLRKMRKKLIEDKNVTDFATKKKITSAIRRLAPNGQSNEMGWSANIRSIRHMIEMRTSRHAEWEIRLIFNQIADIMNEYFPLMLYGSKVELIDGMNEYTNLKV